MSKRRDFRLELLWGTFAAANMVALFVFPTWQVVPHHYLWIGLVLVYGARVWPLRPTVAVLSVVVGVTVASLSLAAINGDAQWRELVEVPLMLAVFIVVVFHARRRQAAFDAVERSVERERNFVREASHRLRTPITIARGHAELLREVARDPDSASDSEAIIDELDRLTRVVHQLLILTAVEQPKFLLCEAIDFERLIVSAGRRWGPTASRHWLVKADTDGTLFADKARLDEAIDALIENAIKFTDSADRIGVVGRADGDTAVIEISNTGKLIPEHDLSRIFDRFYRSERNGRSEGTGLGLALVKAVAEAHEGRVTVENVPGHGVVFTLRVPGFRADLADDVLSLELPESAVELPAWEVKPSA